MSNYRERIGLEQEFVRANRFANLVAVSLCAYPVLWLTGLGGIFIMLLALPSAVYLLRARISAPALMSLLVGAAIGLSVPVGIAAFGFDPLRLIGTIANLCLWVVLAAVLTAAEKVDVRARIFAGLCVIVAAQGLLIALSAGIYPARLPVPLLDPVARSLPSGIAAFADNALYVRSWLGQTAYRTSGIMGNPTWAAAIASLVILGLIAGRDTRPRRLVGFAALAGGVVSVYFGLSRTSYALLGAGAVVIVLLWIRRRSRLAFVGAVAVSVPLLIAFLLANGGRLSAFLSEVDDARSGSSASRGEVYSQTWAYVLANPFPLLGYGIKPQEDGLVASVGTLSTYLGLLFRAGALGLLLFLVLLAMILKRAWRGESPAGVVIVVFVAVWAVIADMDAGHVVPLFLAIAVPPERSPGMAVPHNINAQASRGHRLEDVARHRK